MIFYRKMVIYDIFYFNLNPTIRILFTFLLTFLILPVSGQEERLNFFHITTENGLTSNEITGITQDSSGYMWFATPKGLNRFDGYEFEHFIKIKGDTTSLTDNAISTLFVDSEGILWVGLEYYGLCRFIPEKQQFKRYFSTDDNPVLLGNTINAIVEDKQGDLWIATNLGMNKLSKDKEIFTHYTSEQLLQEDIKYLPGEVAVVDLSIDSATGHIWMAFHESVIAYFNPETELCDHFVFGSQPVFSTILFDKNKVYLGTFNQGTYFYHPESGTITSTLFDIDATVVQDIVQGPEGFLWICTSEGLIKHNPVNNNYKQYAAIDGDILSLAGNSTISVFFGNNNLMWVSIFRNGINYAIRYKPFNHFLINGEHFYGLSHPEVSCMLVDDNSYWVGYHSTGIELFNMSYETKQFYQLHNKKGNATGTVFTIYKDSKNNTWAGSWGGGLQILNTKKNRFEPFEIKDDSNKSFRFHHDVRAICEDDSGNLWMALHGDGLFKLDESRNSFNLFSGTGDSSEISNNWIYDVIWDDKFIWVATVWGLNRFNKTSNKVKQYYYDPEDTTTISSNRVKTLYKDVFGTIWIGTAAGLNYYDKERDSFVRITSSEKLATDEIHSIISDNNNYLWVAGSKGLAKLLPDYKMDSHMPDIEDIIYYNRNDGLISYEFFVNSAEKDEEGILYFGGNNGIDFFNPASIKDQTMPPPLVISSIKVYNKLLPNKHQKTSDVTVVLSHDQNMLTFEFAALSFVDPENNRYSYMLEGLEDKWNHPTTNRIANYSNLDPGAYTFMVKGSNSDGVWNNNAVQWRFLIKPPWYGTHWFKTMVALLFISGIWAFFVMRTAHMRKRQQVLETSVKERTKELHEQSAMLEEQTEHLNNVNYTLEEKQKQIEKQSHELEAKTRHLADVNEQLNVSNSMKDKILSIIAHDLKSPFNTILGFSELLQNGYESYDDNKRLTMLDYIHSSSRNVYDLLDNLLQWSRSQTDRINISPEMLNLYALVDENYRLLKDLFSKKEIDFLNNVGNECTLHADPNILNTVIRNLITNAIKFSNAGQKIEVDCQSFDDEVIIHVRDQGVGIAEEDIQTLFDLEGATSRTGTQGEAGTGLGLLLCRDFVEKSGGEIWVKSKPGEGSTFSFAIPRY